MNSRPILNHSCSRQPDSADWRCAIRMGCAGDSSALLDRERCNRCDQRAANDQLPDRQYSGWAGSVYCRGQGNTAGTAEKYSPRGAPCNQVFYNSVFRSALWWFLLWPSHGGKRIFLYKRLSGRNWQRSSGAGLAVGFLDRCCCDRGQSPVFLFSIITSAKTSISTPACFLLMQRPYGRIVTMHIAIVFGAGFVMWLGSPLPILLILILAKTSMDLKLHHKERLKMSVAI